MSHSTWKKALACLRTLTWVFAAASAPQAAFAQSSPPVPEGAFGVGSVIQLDPAAMGLRLQEEMERCRNFEDTGDVYEKVGCKTLDAALKISLGHRDAGPMLQMMRPMLISQVGLMIRDALTAMERMNGLPSEARQEAVEETSHVAHELGNRVREVHLLIKQGEGAVRTGSYQEAEARFNEALSLLEGLDSKLPDVASLKARTMNSHAQLYILLGMPKEATEAATAARAAAEETADPTILAMSEFLLQWAQRLENKPNQFEEMAKILSKVFEDSNISAPHGLVQLLPQVMSQDEEAGLRALSALEQMSGLPPPWDRILRPMVLSQRAIHEERFEDALRALGQMRDEIHRQNLPDLEVWVLTSIAAVQWRLGRPEDALARAREAVMIVESLQGDLGDPTGLMGFHGSERRWIYQFAIELLARSGRAEEAFDMAERARARALLYLLGGQKTSPGRQALDPIGVKTLQAEALPQQTTLIAYYMSGERIFA